MTSTRKRVVLGSVIAMLACVGCDSKDAGTASRDAMMKAWNQAGLTSSSFQRVEVFGSEECTQGTINGVSTTLCAYADETQAQAAQPKGLESVGDDTGTALVNGATLLVVADRASADPQGRVINRITKIFRGQSLRAHASVQ